MEEGGRGRAYGARTKRENFSSLRKEGHIPAGNGSLRVASSLRSSLEPGTVIKRDFSSGPGGLVEWNRRGTSRKRWTLQCGGKKGHDGILCAGLFAPLRRFGFFLFLSSSFLAALCVRSSLYFGLDPRRTLQLTVYTQVYRDHGENNCAPRNASSGKLRILAVSINAVPDCVAISTPAHSSVLRVSRSHGTRCVMGEEVKMLGIGIVTLLTLRVNDI